MTICFYCSCSLLFSTDIQVNHQYQKNNLKYKSGWFIEKNLIILIHPSLYLDFPFLICDEHSYPKECPHHAAISKFVKGSPTLTILKDPFPPQDKKMVSHDQSCSSTLTDIMMMSSKVMVATRSKDYKSKSHVEDADDSSPTSKTSTSTPPSSEPLHIEKQNHNMIIHLPPKGVFGCL